MEGIEHIKLKMLLLPMTSQTRKHEHQLYNTSSGPFGDAIDSVLEIESIHQFKPSLSSFKRLKTTFSTAYLHWRK